MRSGKRWKASWGWEGLAADRAWGAVPSWAHSREQRGLGCAHERERHHLEVRRSSPRETEVTEAVRRLPLMTPESEFHTAHTPPPAPRLLS